MIHITPTIAIDEAEVQEQFILASGPGGQNVNKVAAAVQLRFDAARSPALTDEMRQRLVALAGKRMTGDGVLVIKARRFRSQGQNREDALDRLIGLIREAAVEPRLRHATRPTLASKQRRLEEKGRHGATKRLRGPVERSET